MFRVNVFWLLNFKGLVTFFKNVNVLFFCFIPSLVFGQEITFVEHVAPIIFARV